MRRNRSTAKHHNRAISGNPSASHLCRQGIGSQPTGRSHRGTERGLAMHDRYRPKIIRGGEAPPQQESRAIGVWVLAATLVLVNSAASAGESAFAYVYTTDLLPQGA